MRKHLSSPSGWGLVSLSDGALWARLEAAGMYSHTHAHCRVNGASHAVIFADRLKVSNLTLTTWRELGHARNAFLFNSPSTVRLSLSLSYSAVVLPWLYPCLAANMSFIFLLFKHVECASLSVSIKILKVYPTAYWCNKIERNRCIKATCPCQYMTYQ